MDKLTIRTLFLDAGGVLCHPAWPRVSAALQAEGVIVSAERLAAAEARAKHDMDVASVVGATSDAKRGWLYFNKVLEHCRHPAVASDRCRARDAS